MVTEIRHWIIKKIAGKDAVVLNMTFNLAAKDVYSSDPAKHPSLIEIPKGQSGLVCGCTFNGDGREIAGA